MTVIGLFFLGIFVRPSFGGGAIRRFFRILRQRFRGGCLIRFGSGRVRRGLHMHRDLRGGRGWGHRFGRVGRRIFSALLGLFCADLMTGTVDKQHPDGFKVLAKRSRSFDQKLSKPGWRTNSKQGRRTSSASGSSGFLRRPAHRC